MSDTVSNLLEFIRDEDLAPGEPEHCGVILTDGSIMALLNVHEEPTRGFHIDPKGFKSALEEGAIATWHTHPAQDPNLSEEDMNGFRQWPDLTHYIIGVRDGAKHVETFKVLEDGIVVNL